MSRFEVIIPVLNADRTLRHTLQTLVDLPNDDVSFLISNNSSTDSTPEILEEFKAKDSRFKIVKTSDTLPLKDSLEFAMSHATGDYLMVIGGDDGLYNGCIEVAKEALRQHPQAKAVAHRRSFLLWPDVPDHCGHTGFPPGGLRLSASNTFDLRNAREDLRSQALSIIHGPTPAPYQGWVSMEIVKRIRARVGRVFGHYVTDFWFASATGAELDNAPYVFSGLPLSIGAYSAHSSALSFFANTTSDAAEKKLSLERNTEQENLVFTSKSARGYRYEILKLVLQYWPNAPFTARELDLNYLCGFWEEWKHRTLEEAKGGTHKFAGSTEMFRKFIDQTAASVGMQDLIADLDRQYVPHGDNRELWRKWGTSFQLDHDWAHDICVDTRRLGCKNVHDVAKVMTVLVEAVMQAGDSFAKILSGKELAGGPPDSPPPDWGSAGFAAVKQMHESLQQKALQAARREADGQKKQIKLQKAWRAPEGAPWALRAGLQMARFLGKVTGSGPK